MDGKTFENNNLDAKMMQISSHSLTVYAFRSNRVRTGTSVQPEKWFF